MTPTQILIARATVAGACGAAALAVTSTPRWKRMPVAEFDRWLQIAFAISRVGLFVLLFFVLRMPPRGDITIYMEQARWLMQGRAVYRDFVSAYAPLFPYLNAVLLRVSSAGLGIMFTAIVCEFLLVRLWLRSARSFFTDEQVRMGALLYLTSAMSVQYVAIDGQNNALAGLTVTAGILLLNRYRDLLSGFLLGVGIVVVKFLPLVYAPFFFVTSHKRWRWTAGLLLCCVPVYGWFALRHYPLLVPLTSEGSYKSSGNVPFLVESVLGFTLPNRLYDGLVLLALAAIFALVLRRSRNAGHEARLRVLSFGVAAATLALVLLAKKSWPPYLIMVLFPICVSLGRSWGRTLLFGLVGIAACMEPSSWWLAYNAVSAVEIHHTLSARPATAVLFYGLELALVAGYGWLLWLAVQAIANASSPRTQD